MISDDSWWSIPPIRTCAWSVQYWKVFHNAWIRCTILLGVCGIYNKIRKRVKKQEKPLSISKLFLLLLLNFLLMKNGGDFSNFAISKFHARLHAQINFTGTYRSFPRSSRNNGNGRAIFIQFFGLKSNCLKHSVTWIWLPNFETKHFLKRCLFYNLIV